MEDQNAFLNEPVSESYDAADRLFDFVGEGGATALVCESDPAVREKIGDGLKDLDYQITSPEKTKEALKAMRFHVFDVVVVNELFDTANPEANEVLQYLENLNMTTRRRFFVALVSEKYRTMDNVAAFNRSVNLVINIKSIEDTGKIIKQGLADNKAFYHIFQETLQKMGKA
jgi:response regulator RpfG family c-di-GMP phosphodiesterase